MKYRWMSALVIVLVAIVTGCITYQLMRKSRSVCTCENTQNGGDALAWIRQEFKLTAQQTQRIETLHAAYQTVCVRHCSEIQESRTQLAQARTQNRPPEEIATAQTHIAAVDAECKASTATHVKQIADVIGGDEGKRYLAIVLPRIAAFEHDGPATLDLGANSQSRTQQSQPSPAPTTHEHHAGH